MNIQQIIDIINFNILSIHDLSGKAINSPFGNTPNTFITTQLNLALLKYAQYTKALESIKSMPIGSISLITPPSDIIRSQGINFMTIVINSFKYPIQMQDISTTIGNFPVQSQGIPTWGFYWQNLIQLYPQNNNTYAQTLLTNDILATDTTINVESTAGFEIKAGRITIGNEVIYYDSITLTSFINCKRGMEGTIASANPINTPVLCNNLWFYYFKKHFNIPVNPDDSIPANILAMESDVPDEHLEVITDYTSYKLLHKL